MKSTMYLSGTIGSFLAINGITFKTMHWPGANIMLITGLFLLLAVYIPTLTTFHFKKSLLNKFNYFAGTLGGITLLTGVIFKILHFAGAGVMIISGTFIFSLLFIPFYGYYQFKKS